MKSLILITISVILSLQNLYAKDSVVVAMSGGLSAVVSLDSTIAGLRFTVHTHLYDPIIQWDPHNQKYVPKLAKSWERINNETVRFHLRRDVKFHNGSDFSAYDVEFYINRVKDPDVGSPAKGWYEPIKEIKVIDDYTFDAIGSPYGIIPTMNMLAPVDKETYLEVGADNYAKNPIGTGPYKYVAWEKENFIDLVANEDYWDGAPSIKYLKFKIIKEAATKIAMLYKGEADIIDLVPPHMAKEIKNKPNFDVRSVGSLRAIFLTLNTFKKPFNDLRVRKALAYAINWDEIIDQLYAGYAYKIGAIHPKGVHHYCNIQPHEYDPKKAKQLLRDAGSEGLEFQMDSPSSWFYLDKEATQIIVNQLQKVGIKPKFWSAERGTFWDHWVNKNSQASYMACGNVQSGADFCYRLHFHSARRGIYYNSVEIENILDTFANSSDERKQKNLACQFQQYVNDNVPYIPGYVAEQIFATNKKLQWQPNADERIYLHDARWIQN